MHDIVLGQQEFSEISAVLASYACDQSCLDGDRTDINGLNIGVLFHVSTIPET